MVSSLLLPQRAVCNRKAVLGEEHGREVRRKVHQEAAELGQLAGSEAGGDPARGGHPAAGPAPQHRDAARRLRKPHRRGSHPGAVSQRARQDALLEEPVNWSN